MAESTLSLTREQIKADLGNFAGYGRGAVYGSKAWTTKQDAALDAAVKSGLQKFYKPPKLDGESVSHNWSFLKPVQTLTYAEAATTILLPDDFGGLDGAITVRATSGTINNPWRLPIVNEGQVREQYASTPSRTGKPMAVALQPIQGTTNKRGQRFQLYLYPIADQDYTLDVPYYLLPDVLDGTHPYAYGGALHADTILAACKAAFERDMDDLENGPQKMNFMECLAASVSKDRNNKPQYLGLNTDSSDRVNYSDLAQHGWGWGGITYRGEAL